jgi:tetratricopeptide (TPR) repeat protein
MAERIVADGRRLSIRHNDCLVGAGGQLQLGFYTEGLTEDLPLDDVPPAAAHPGVATLAISVAVSADDPFDDDSRDLASVAELLDLAADLEASGALSEAAEALRAVLQAQGPTAQVVFMLAELLYRAGDLTAARERYYAAVELDADHLEARSSLGCVLAELGEHELALAALDGVLRQQPDYADAHWHLAGVLRDVGRESESQRHLRTFLALAPESPWATMARDRLTAVEPIVT